MRTYSRQQVNEVIARYNNTSDPVASAEASREIHALAEGRKRETGEKYSDALRSILRTPPEHYAPPETDQAKVHAAGVELLGVAEAIKASGKVVFFHGIVTVGKVSGREALKLAILSNPILGATYTGHEIMDDATAYQQVKRLYADRSK